MPAAIVPAERVNPGMSAASPRAILAVEGIVKRFVTSEGPITAVDHVSLSVAPGEFLVPIVTHSSALPALLAISTAATVR